MHTFLKKLLVIIGHYSIEFRKMCLKMWLRGRYRQNMDISGKNFNDK